MVGVSVLTWGRAVMWLTRESNMAGACPCSALCLAVVAGRGEHSLQNISCISAYFPSAFQLSHIMSSLHTALTLSSTSSFSSPNPELFTPPPSHTSLQQVPDVFVIPPEEEHDENPPFCYFDAAMESKRSLCTTPDIDALDVALGFYQQTEGNPAPVFQRMLGNESQETVVMPRRSDSRFQDVPSSVSRSGRRIIDEDVVEVVKVRKSEGMSNSPEEPRGYTLKKSKTFRARASQALRSIKNVGKSSRRAGIPETWSTTASGRENAVSPVSPTSPTNPFGPSEQGVLPQPVTPSIARRKSIQLSQIFTTSRSRSSAPDVPMSPTSTTSSEWSALSRPSISIEDCTPSPYPSSPTTAEAPTLGKRRSFVRRISVLDLHKLFSPSTPTSSKPPPLPVPAREPIVPSPSHSSSKRDSMPPSSTASSGLSSVDDVFSIASPSVRPHSFHASGSQFSMSRPAEDDEAALNRSLDLHLDSLHFDSLHFDPDEF